MTLSDLASLICTKVNASDAEDLVACKLFLARRHEMIWRDQLWKDSLCEWSYTLPTTYEPTDSWLPSSRVLLCPSQFDRVLALRTDIRALRVRSGEFFYQTDFNAFVSQGSAVEYVQLPPVVWQFDIPQFLSLTSQAGDDGKTVSAQVVASQDAAPTVLSGAFSAANGLALGQALIINSIRKGVTKADVALAVRNRLWDGLNKGADVVNEDGLQNVDATLPPGGSIGWGPAQALVITTDLVVADEIPVPGGMAFVGEAELTTVNGTDGLVFAARARGNSLGNLAAADANTPRRPRLRLMGNLNAGTVIRVLGKSNPPALSDDNDVPAINGMENALISYVQADMLERDRHYAKAQQCMQQAAQLLDQLKRVEVVQQAFNKTIQPAEGYGNPYDLWSHPPLTY